MNTKLIASYAFVAAVMSASLVGFARADGVDEPDPSVGADKHGVNYWRDFDQHPCQYDVGLPNAPCFGGSWGTPRADWFFEPVPQGQNGPDPVKSVKNVPEPEPVLLLGVALILPAIRRLKNGHTGQ